MLLNIQISLNLLVRHHGSIHAERGEHEHLGAREEEIVHLHGIHVDTQLLSDHPGKMFQGLVQTGGGFGGGAFLRAEGEGGAVRAA